MALPNSTESKDKELRVVAIGGGTGLSTLLRGLKRYVAPDRRRAIRIESAEGFEAPAPPPRPSLHCVVRELSAVVTVTDDGGSSGRLREDLKMLPPGDIRNCMVALSEDEHLLSKLFQFRFEHGDLEGHSFGNLFVAALSRITGDFAQAVQMSSQILATRGRIFPATNANVGLVAAMDDGSLVRGETNITASKHSIIELRLEDVRRLLADRKISLELTDAAKDLLFTQGYDPNFGARPLKRAIQKLIQDPLALKILDGEVLHGDHVIVDADKKAGKMRFEVSKRVGEKEPAKAKR